MKHSVKKTFRAGLLFALSAAVVPSVNFGVVNVLGGEALAQQSSEPKIDLPGCKQPPEKRKLRTVPQKFIKKVTVVDNLIQPPEDEKTGKAAPPDFRKAWTELQELMADCKDDECSRAEWATLYQRAAIIQYNLDNPKGAIENFLKVIEQAPDIHISLETSLTYQVAQLYSAEENYAQALKWFDRWESLCPSTVNDSYFYSRGQTLYLMDRKDEALRQVQKSIDLRKAKGEIGDESWYRLKMAIFIDKEDYKSAESVAETLVVNFPNDRVMTQLAQIYGMNNKLSKQRAMMDALKVADILNKESHYRSLSYLFLDAETPYLAAKTLEKGIKEEIVERSSKNLEAWGMSLYQAQETEKALPIMEEAARKSDDGKLYSRLAAIYYDAEKYDEAITAGKEALRKKGLKSEAEAHLYLGLSYMNQKKYEEAIENLKQASKEDRYEKTASDLLRYVRREQKRDDQLRQADLSS